MRHFSPYIRQQRTLLIISAIALVADVVLRLLEPWPLKFVFDYVLIPSVSQRLAVFPVLNQLDSAMLLTGSAIICIGISSICPCHITPKREAAI